MGRSLTIRELRPSLPVVERNSESFIDHVQPADGLPGLTPAARSLAEYVRTIIGPTVLGVLHYGSRAQGRHTRGDSAFDFFVVVESYRQAYEALAVGIGNGFRAGLGVALAWVLPPSAVAIRRRGSKNEQEAKSVIISMRHFLRECSPRARDHFVGARLSQHTLLAWSRDSGSAEALLSGVQDVRRRSFDWVRVYLPPRFDTAQYCQTQLDVSFAHEIRVEASNHAATLFATQRDSLLGIYGPILEHLVERKVLAHDGDQYKQTRPAGPFVRLRVRSYFRLSKLRTTLRLLKHPFLYDQWLDYLVHKIDRSTGEMIELTERERQRPLIFLWPRVFRYLRNRPQVKG